MPVCVMMKCHPTHLAPTGLVFEKPARLTQGLGDCRAPERVCSLEMGVRLFPLYFNDSRDWLGESTIGLHLGALAPDGLAVLVLGGIRALEPLTHMTSKPIPYHWTLGDHFIVHTIQQMLT